MRAVDPAKQILIVDQDAAEADPVRQRLGEAGFGVRIITSATAATALLHEQPPALLMLDWETAGFAIYEMIRVILRGPRAVRLIILSTAAGEDHVVTALNLGADDYIVRPYSIPEVVARVSAVLRLRRRRAEQCLRCEDVVLEPATQRLIAHGVSMSIRGAEYRLLEFLMTHHGRTFSRHQLLSEIWGSESDIDERTVDVNVQRLRKTLAARGYASWIHTVRGVGYRFDGPADPVDTRSALF